MITATAPVVVRKITAMLYRRPLLLNGNKLFSSGFVHFSYPAEFGSSEAVCYCNLAKPTKGIDNLLVARAGNTSSIEAVDRVLDMAKQASSQWEVFHTDFLTPTVLKNSLIRLEKNDDIKCITEGGYPQAERCRLFLGPPQLLETTPNKIAGLSIKGDFRFQSSSHGDFLGAILGTGIASEKVGDVILQGDTGAQFLVVPEVVEFLVFSLKEVRKVPVSCATLPLHALKYEPPRTLSFKTIEASLRVDAIASAGFKVSRTKIIDLIRGGEVCVNSIVVKKGASTLKTGDDVSLTGKGRFKVGDISTTKRGRYAVELTRFL